MKLSELLTYYRHRDSLSLESVGDFVGVSKSTVKRWESGESSNVPQARLDRLSELFGIDVPACLQGHFKPFLGYVKAGYALFANENLLGYEEGSAREAAHGDYYRRVQGDSMTGTRIYDGDLVYVKSCSDVENGDIAVVLLNHSEVTIKKILKKEHTVILMATNPVVEPRVFTQEEIEEGQLKIIGKVLHSKIRF